MRNRIYSLKVFYFLLNRRRYFYLLLNCFSTPVSDDQKYVCGRRLYACINTRKFRGLDSIEITSLPEIKNVIYMARQIILIIAENKPHATTRPFAYNESLQNPTITVLLIKILIFFRPLSSHGSVHLFQSNRRFQAIEFVDRHISEKL